MKLLFFISLTILSLLYSCNSKSDNGTIYIAENNRADTEIDSIIIKSLLPDIDDDSLIIELTNPYSDTITLDSEYKIISSNNDSVLLHGYMPSNIVIPDSSYTFKVSLGLDSIEYSKSQVYKFIFKGNCNGTNIIYHNTVPLGNRYKLNGETILEPDTIILATSGYFYSD